MSELGSKSAPLRVAIVGSGPAGFYTVSNLLKHKELCVEIDMFEKLPTPFGLVRAGVAPDHQKEKTVVRAYDKSAAFAGFRYFGNVEYGKHLLLADLQAHYHQLVFATGAQSDRSLGIPGEEAPGSYAATEFVAWYNGHPEFASRAFNLDATSVAIVGMGNVAVDVARILCKTPNELAHTDIADYALEALRHSRIKDVFVLGRRGPAQAAFSTPEIKEMASLSAADLVVRTDEATLDDLSRAALASSGDKNAAKNVAQINEFAQRQAGGKEKRFTIRFLVSPTEIVTDEAGSVSGVRIARNKLYKRDDGTLGVTATNEEELLPVQMIFRSVGYQGIPIAGLPFDGRAGVVPNTAGRVNNANHVVVPGLYVAGWIKRGPTGVIGSNKTDAKETVACMVEDWRAGVCQTPATPSAESIVALLQTRLQALQPAFVSYANWRELDDIEISKGIKAQRPRVKFTNVGDMLAVLQR